MILLELLNDILLGIKEMKQQRVMTRMPKTWDQIAKISRKELGERYRMNVDDMFKNIRLLSPEKLWKPDDKNNEKDKYRYIVSHRFDFKTPIVFLIKVDQHLFLCDTEGSDRIIYAVEIV